MVTRLACAHIASALPPTGVRLPLIWIDQRCPKVDQARTAIFKEWYTSTAPETSERAFTNLIPHGNKIVLVSNYQFARGRCALANKQRADGV
jgi:hypothetical protein